MYISIQELATDKNNNKKAVQVDMRYFIKFTNIADDRIKGMHPYDPSSVDHMVRERQVT